MECKAVQEKLSLYLDGELSISDIKLIEEHTKMCTACREELSSLEETVNLVRSLEPVDVPSDLKDKIMERVKTVGDSNIAASRWQHAWNRWGRAFSSVAAILIAAVLIGKAASGPGFGLKSQAPVADEALKYAGAKSEVAESAMPEEQYQATPRLMQQPMSLNKAEAESGWDQRSTEADTRNLLMARKVIQTAHLSIQVEKIDIAADQLQQLVKEYHGFIQNSNMLRQEIGRGAHFALRVPSPNFDEVLIQLEKLGDVQEKGTTGQDITEEYVDVDARCRNLSRQEERLLTILSQASTVEDILKVEEQLERVRGEIETLTGRLRYLDNQVELATINVELRERPHSVTALQFPNSKDLGARLTQALTSSINLLFSLASNAVVWIVTALPFLAVVGIIAAVAGWLWRHFIRR